MQINSAQRIILLAAVMLIVGSVIVAYVDYRDIQCAFEVGLELSLTPLVVMGLLFVAALGIPEAAWPWSREKLDSRQLKKLKTTVDKLNVDIDELVENEMKSTMALSLKVFEVIYGAPNPSNTSARIVTQSGSVGSFDQMMAETHSFQETNAKLAALLFSYSLHFLTPLKTVKGNSILKPKQFWLYRSKISSRVAELESQSIQQLKTSAETMTGDSNISGQLTEREAGHLLELADLAREELEHERKATLLLKSVLDACPKALDARNRSEILKSLGALIEDQVRKQTATPF